MATSAEEYRTAPAPRTSSSGVSIRANLRRRQTRAIYPLPTLQLQILLLGQTAETPCEIGKFLLEPWLMYDDATRGDCADGEFRLPGHANLAHEHDIERRMEHTRDLVSHGDASPRNA